MNDIEQNFLAGKLIRILRDWINKIIPEETKNCLRSKVGIIVKVEDEKDYYKVVFPEDYQKYFDLGNDAVDVNLTKEERKEAEEERENITLRIKDFMGIDVRGKNLEKNDIVTIIYTDNKLTNAFILCANGKYEKEGRTMNG